MASFSYFLTAVLFVILGLAYAGAQNPHPDLQNFYDGIKAQERILNLGRYRKMLPDGNYTHRTIIPIDEALNCFACSSDVTCTKSCENFYHLVHSIAEVHDEYQKLTAIRDQTADDQDIEVLKIILKRLSTQACSLLTSKLGANNFDCTYTELMKAKTKLELLFVTRRIGKFLSAYSDSLALTPEDWMSELMCNITDTDLHPVVHSAFGTGVRCPEK